MSGSVMIGVFAVPLDESTPDPEALFFEPRNLALVADWADRRSGGQGRFAAAGGALVRRDAGMDNIVVALPADFAIPDVAAVAALRDALQ